MENRNKQISVIIPVYNAEKYLERCIDSILAQTYYDIQIILVNDGSTDTSLSICKSYASDKRVLVIDKLNGGVGSARNCGLDNAQGDYIIFIDSDDFIDRNMFEKMLMIAEKEESDVVFCGFKEIQADGSVCIVDEKEAFEQYLTDKDLSCFFNYNKQNRIGTYVWRALYRSQVILNNIRFDEKVYINEDDIFLCNILLNSKRVSYVDEHFYNYLQIGSDLGYKKYKEKQDYYLIKKRSSEILRKLFVNNGYEILGEAIIGMACLDIVSALCSKKRTIHIIKQIKREDDFFSKMFDKRFYKSLIMTQKDLKFAKKMQIMLCYKALPFYVMFYKIFRKLV